MKKRWRRLLALLVVLTLLSAFAQLGALADDTDESEDEAVTITDGEDDADENAAEDADAEDALDAELVEEDGDADVQDGDADVTDADVSDETEEEEPAEDDSEEPDVDDTEEPEEDDTGDEEAEDQMWVDINSSGAVDIRGYEDGVLIQTTYANHGYIAVLKVGDEVTTLRFTASGVPITVSGLTITPYLSISSNGMYAFVSYVVENDTTNEITYSLGVHVDVDINGNDYATVEITDTGVKMTDTNSDYVYYLAVRNTAGIIDSDTLWIGAYPYESDNVFNDSVATTVTNTDSALAFSWQNRTLMAYSSDVLSYETGIGKGTVISAPEVHDHTWGAPTAFTWYQDYSSCIAVVPCTECSVTANMACTVTSEDGYHHTASIVIGDETYTNEVYGAGIAQGTTYEIGSSSPSTIVCSISAQYFVSVYVDGVLESPQYYTVTEGSTILTFSSEYLDSLSPGEHTVELHYSINGVEVVVDTTLTVTERTSTGGNTGNTGNNGNADGSKNGTSATSPQTGYTNSAVWLVLAAVLLAGAVMCLGLVKKIDKKAE